MRRWPSMSRPLLAHSSASSVRSFKSCSILSDNSANWSRETLRGIGILGPLIKRMRDQGLGITNRSHVFKRIGLETPIPIGMIGKPSLAAKKIAPGDILRRGPRGPSGVRPIFENLAKCFSWRIAAAPPFEVLPRTTFIPAPSQVMATNSPSRCCEQSAVMLAELPIPGAADRMYSCQKDIIANLDFGSKLAGSAGP